MQRRADPRAHRYIVDHVPPGTGIERRLLVVNKSAQPRRVDVYAGAASIEQGRFRFASGRTGNELTSWITVGESTVDLAAYGQAEVEVAIAVPTQASEGERYAVVWAATGASADGTDAAEIRQVHRTGVRVYLDVGMGGEPRSDFSIEGMVPARDNAGTPSLTVGVRNTGGRAVDLTGEVDLADGPAGIRAGPFDVATATTLLPGESGEVRIELPGDLPAGPWTVTVRLRSGRIEHSATGRITFPAPGTTGVPATLAAQMVTTPTVVGASLLVGLVLLTGVGLVARRVRSA
ncbi:hypothetical protein O7623_17640 [Solwaraspora sp. WMMD791]|uniref:hypothetical protein n=1 Tax=Solwaraspora sp. WMMD791 TaxID=3016086 RepID=UPI00249BC3BF|nr:hypothetical protein [Solwaraspora sp. WMMD791]WFE25227.1 hypothetical protein O7623_17640 [Solwaraspora sp. WMMD791]